jgi:hypothetical protein
MIPFYYFCGSLSLSAAPTSMKIKTLESAVADLAAGRKFYERQEIGVGDYFSDCLMIAHSLISFLLVVSEILRSAHEVSLPACTRSSPIFLNIPCGIDRTF